MALREAILGLLDDRPMTGYEIKQFFRNVIRHFWSVSDGQLYPTLKKMHEDGLVKRKVVRQESTANKQVYSITERGRERFRRWLREPVRKFEELKEPFVLKVFFFSKLSREEVLSHLRFQLDLHSRILDEFRSIRDTYEEKVTDYQRLVGYVGILYVEVRILWLAKMIEWVQRDQIDAQLGRYTEDMVEIGRRFFEEVLSDDPSREFLRWLERAGLRMPFGAAGSREAGTRGGAGKGRGSGRSRVRGRLDRVGSRGGRRPGMTRRARAAGVLPGRCLLQKEV